jgi:hypothetical protein
MMAEKSKKDYFEMMDGNIRFWIEQESSIHIQAFDHRCHDPVELTWRQARQLASALQAMADRGQSAEDKFRIS